MRCVLRALEITVGSYLQNYQPVPVQQLGVADMPESTGTRTKLKTMELKEDALGKVQLT